MPTGTILDCLDSGNLSFLGSGDLSFLGSGDLSFLDSESPSSLGSPDSLQHPVFERAWAEFRLAKAFDVDRDPFETRLTYTDVISGYERNQ
jgi:hypothetical protein